MIRHLRFFRRFFTGSPERGSLALEQILIIAAIITMSTGLFLFYDNISNYFRTLDLSSLPTTVSAGSGTSSGSGAGGNNSGGRTTGGSAP